MSFEKVKTFDVDISHLDDIKKIRTGDVIYLDNKLYIFDGWSVAGFQSSSIGTDIVGPGDSELRVIVRSVGSFSIKVPPPPPPPTTPDSTGLMKDVWPNKPPKNNKD